MKRRNICALGGAALAAAVAGTVIVSRTNNVPELSDTRVTDLPDNTKAVETVVSTGSGCRYTIEQVASVGKPSIKSQEYTLKPDDTLLASTRGFGVDNVQYERSSNGNVWINGVPGTDADAGSLLSAYALTRPACDGLRATGHAFKADAPKTGG